MSGISRRQWIRKSLLSSSAVLIGGEVFKGLERRALPPQSSPGAIRLHWNENPYGPSKKALEAISAVLAEANHYPDPIVEKLKNKLAKKHRLSQENILITAGSTEILSLLGQHVGLIKGEILMPWPSFPTMANFGEVCGASIRKVNIGADDCIDLNKLLPSVNDQTSLIFICNPNNPTSTEVNTSDLKSFCRAVPEHVLICIDEAYIEYSLNGSLGSLVSLVDELPNLVISRTFSKVYGLAGLRIGYAVSHKNNITALRSRHTGYELSAGTAPLIGAITTLEDQEFVQYCLRKNEEGRRIVSKAFEDWGVEYAPSSTNFIYAKSRYFDPDIRAKLRADHILITKWRTMKDHIRISIGKPEEMELFVKMVEKYLVL